MKSKIEKSMNVNQIFELAIKKGVEADFRSKEDIDDLMKREKENYEKMSEIEKGEYNEERLTNPFSDTGISNLASNNAVKKILAGIDIEEAELLLIDKMGDVDLALAHHPIGKYLSNLSDVMHMQADILSQYGVPINIAESLLKEKISEISRKVSPINHNKVVDFAKLLKINFMNVHTPCDNLAASFLDNQIKKSKIKYVSDLLKVIKAIPEYAEAIKIGAGPKIYSGSENNRTGKIVLTEITGGTEGSSLIYEKMSQVGVGTIVGMHMSEENRKEAQKAHINVVIAGHISSDSLGMNLFLDDLEKNGIEIIPCGGLIRIKRF